MKSTFLTGLLSLSFFWAISQDDLFIVNNWPAQENQYGIKVLHGINPDNASFSGTPYQYAGSESSTESAAMAISPNGSYIYYIKQENGNNGQFSVYSIPAYTTSAPTGITGTFQFTADLNGSDNDEIFFRRLGISKDGWAYMMMTDVTGNISLARFQTDPTTGAASNFTNLGLVTLDGATSTPNFNNGDLALDGTGNMYILVNEDIAGGEAAIYYLPASDLAEATGPGSVTDIKKKYVLKDESGVNFTGIVTGIALSSTGKIYISVQAIDHNTINQAGIYYIDSKAENGTAKIKGPAYTDNDMDKIADLATNYFPGTTVLPVIYGPISAKIVGGSLIVNWSTLKEINNTRFEVEVSKDGKHFTNIGTVDTKAPNGNSDETISYSFTKTIDIPVAAMGISFLSLAVVFLFINRKNRVLFSIMMIMGIGLAFASCSKNGEQVDVSREGKLFVRIIQVNQDGSKFATESITAYNAD